MKTSNFMNFWCVFATVVFVCTGLQLRAQALDDYRTAGSGNWNSLSTWQRYDGANWVSAAVLPSNAAGIITIRNGHTVTVSDNRTIDQTVVETGASLNQTGGVLILNNGAGDDLTVNGSYSISGGTLTGSGNVEVLGDITWQSGGISSTVVINVASNATLNINGPLGKTFEGSAVINLYGTGTWSAGTINVSSSTQRLNIFGTLNTSGSVSSSWNSPSSAEFVIKPGGVVNNTGSVSLTANSFRFINEGTLNVLSGTFAVNTLSTLSGEINVSEFATFSYNSNTMTLNSGALFSGAGLKLLNGGTMTIAANCTLSGGTLQNVAATMNGTSTLSVNSGATFNWQSGTISGSAKVDVLSGGTLTINTVNAKNMGGTAEINHYGTGTWSAGTINASTGTHRINIYGILDINGAVSTSWNSVSTAEFVIKSGGVVNKSNGTTSLDANSFRFINEGTLNVLSGTFAVNTLATISGEINASSGGTFSYNANTATLNAGTLFSGAGLKVLNSGTMTIASNCSVNGGTFRQTGGTLNGTATLSVNSGATFNWQGGTISGSAKVDVLSGGTLTINDVFTKNMGGTAEINHYGTGTWSAGSINASSGTQRINIYGNLGVSGFLSTSFNSPSTSQFIVKPSGILQLNTATVTYGSNAFTVTNEGTIRGSGTILFNTVFSNSGNLEPGLNIGILTINGSMPIGGNSNLVIQLQDGSGPGSGHDQLTRNTNLVLAGSLTVLETGPVPNGTYTIIQLTAGIISGAFATVNLPPYYTLQVNSNNVQVIRNVPPCFDEFSSFNITTCGGYVWNNVLYTASGSYDQVFVTNLGCDSTVTLNLTLVPCPTTQLQANFCNISGVTMDMPLRAINVNAPEYRFKVVGPNNGGPGWNGNTFIYDSPTRAFKFQFIPGSLWGEMYSVEVATGNGMGIFGDYGSSCTVTLSGIPTTQLIASNCNIVNVSPNTNLLAAAVTSATGYRYRVNGANVNNFIVTKTMGGGAMRKLKMNEISGIMQGETYSVEVAIRDAAGNWGAYGSICEITLIGAPDFVLNNDADMVEIRNLSHDCFCVRASLNPFTTDFSLQVFNASREELIHVQIFDLSGKLIERHAIQPMDMELSRFGSSLSAGMYVVHVRQGQNKSVFRQLKH